MTVAITRAFCLASAAVKIVGVLMDNNRAPECLKLKLLGLTSLQHIDLFILLNSKFKENFNNHADIRYLDGGVR